MNSNFQNFVRLTETKVAYGPNHTDAEAALVDRLGKFLDPRQMANLSLFFGEHYKRRDSARGSSCCFIAKTETSERQMLQHLIEQFGKDIATQICRVFFSIFHRVKSRKTVYVRSDNGRADETKDSRLSRRGLLAAVAAGLIAILGLTGK